MSLTDDEFFEHFGVKGQKWGVRRAAKKAKKAEQKAALEKAVNKFRQDAMKDIGSRSLSEMYAVRGSRGPTLVMTGREFMERANMGMPFLSVQSTGYRIDDGR